MDPSEGFGYDFEYAQDAEDPVIENDEPLPRARRRRGRHARRRKTAATPRKDRPFRDVGTMSLECCVKNSCLENIGRNIIDGIRRQFDKMLYEAQNNYLISLIDITPQRGNATRIGYNVRDGSGLGKVPVCKTAFLKIFGIGKKRVSILISKLQPYTGQIQEDQRQLFSRNQKRLPTALKVEVIVHIRSYEREISHYARKRTKDKQYLSPTLCLAQLWRDFVKKKDLPPERMPLSFSTFRNIFKTFNLSFRKPRVDTCPKCDSLKILMKYSADEATVEDARALKAAHVRQAELHYSAIKFDLGPLITRRNQRGNAAWQKPPIWKI